MVEAVIFDFGRTLYDPVTSQLFPGTIKVLEDLTQRCLRLGLVTVSETDDVQARLEDLTRFSIRNYFAAVDVIGRSEGKDLAKVLRELGIEAQPQGCVVVGDNLKREIALGNTVGAYTVWTRQRLSADWQPQNELQTPRTIIERIEELIPIIDKLNSD